MNSQFIIDTPEWNRFGHFFKRQEISARTVLLREGEISKKAYYIEQGCIRLWFNNHGRDVTFQFFFEGQAVSSVESFRKGQPSLFTIESIEPCTIHIISKKNFQAILDKTPSIQRGIEDQTFQRLVFYQRLFLSRIKDNPRRRYQELIKDYPNILQRVPQHYIASYLGITPVSLSRIRNRRNIS
jgi:CRP-like cAMP-binding protein